MDLWTKMKRINYERLPVKVLFDFCCFVWKIALNKEPSRTDFSECFSSNRGCPSFRALAVRMLERKNKITIKIRYRKEQLIFVASSEWFPWTKNTSRTDFSECFSDSRGCHGLRALAVRKNANESNTNSLLPRKKAPSPCGQIFFDFTYLLKSKVLSRKEMKL
jgi:hypothetical protein